MTWRAFERSVEAACSTFDPRQWRVAFQREATYRDGQTKRLDVSIAQRRQGGRHFVVDAKHFRFTRLPKNEIDTTLDYKRRSRATSAVIVVSGVTDIPQPVLDHANWHGIAVFEANRQLGSNLRRWISLLADSD